MHKIDTGFYYHFKHDSKGTINNYAYEVIGLGHHTELGRGADDAYMVIYRPLYEAYVYKHGKMFDVRPLTMFTEEVERDGQKFPRFKKITDPQIIAQLSAIRHGMYS